MSRLSIKISLTSKQSNFPFIWALGWYYGTVFSISNLGWSWEVLESVMCDVIKIRLKRRDEGGSGKGNP